MRAAFLLSVAVVPRMAAGTAPESRRLQTDPNDYSSVDCTTAQPDGAFYCNSMQGMEQSTCTCGSCDQVGLALCSSACSLALFRTDTLLVCAAEQAVGA